jgi:hypothetical protein
MKASKRLVLIVVAGAAFAQLVDGRQQKTRSLCLDQKSTIADALATADEIVLLECLREKPNAVTSWSSSETLAGYAEADVVVIARSVDVKARELTPPDVTEPESIQTVVRAHITKVIRDKNRSVRADGPLEFRTSGGELRIGKVTVRTQHHALWNRGSEYLLALSRNSRGELAPDYWAQIDPNGRLHAMEFADRTMNTGFQGQTLTMFLSEFRRHTRK